MDTKIHLCWTVVLLCIICETPSLAQAIFEDYKISASDSEPGDQFGHDVVVDNGFIAVGVPGDDENGVDSGAVYLFSVSSGAQLAKLTPHDGAAGAEFGFSIAISDGLLAIGAPNAKHNGIQSGSAYLFEIATGLQIGKLNSIDGAPGDEFGCSIAIDDGVVGVGAKRDDDFGDSSGAAYLFETSTLTQIRKLLPDQGGSHQNFGVSIAIDDGVVAIGSRTYFDLNEGFQFATAYLFEISDGEQVRKFVSENINGDLGGGFSDAIDIDNGLVAIGAWARSIVFDHSGAVYVFDANSGAQVSYIVPADGHDRDNFGISISIDDGILVIGSHQDDDNGFNSGSAYLYEASSGTQLEKLLASNGDAFDLFGSSAAIGDGVVAIGATGNDDNGENSGSAYVFDTRQFGEATADEYKIVRGLHFGGGLSDTFESDDSYLRFHPGITTGASEPPVWIEFEGSLPIDNPSTLSMTFESGANTVGLTQSIEMFNWQSANYEEVDSRLTSFNKDFVVSLDLSTNISDYIEQGLGKVKARIGWRATNIVIVYPWMVRVDQINWKFGKSMP